MGARGEMGVRGVRGSEGSEREQDRGCPPPLWGLGARWEQEGVRGSKTGGPHHLCGG